MILDDKLLDEVTARAKTSERLRMNFNLHDSLDAKAQRLLNALFLLRHAAVHFAAINIGLRHVLDWCVFVAHCHDRIDWPALYAVARETRMVGFLNCLNALCVDCLGLEAPSLPDFERDAELVMRVLDENLSPAFSGEQPEGLLRVVRFKTRRWWANRWKHRLVFDEGLAGAFVHSAWAHLKRPRSIAH